MSESSDPPIPKVTELPPQPGTRRRRSAPEVPVVDEAAPLPAERTLKEAAKRYDPSYDEEARKLCQRGFSRADLADWFEVDDKTIRRWQIAHPSFDEAMRTGGELADEKVKRSLFDSAIGYEYEEDAIVEGRVVRLRRFAKPEHKAVRMWLMSRQRGDWIDREPTNPTPPSENHLHLHMTPDQARAYIREQQAKQLKLAQPSEIEGVAKR